MTQIQDKAAKAVEHIMKVLAGDMEHLDKFVELIREADMSRFRDLLISENRRKWEELYERFPCGFP